MADPGDRDGDLYDSDMGDDVGGGNAHFDRGESGHDHHSVFGDDRHFSWNSDRDGNVSDVHGKQAGDSNKHDRDW